MRPHRLLVAAALAAACAAVPLPRHSVYHPSDADLSVTRIVHASLILEMRGTRVVVDPWFESGWMIRQQEPLGLTPDGLPSFAAVLVTHRHHDHFDPRALRRLAATVPEVIARPELHARLAHLGFQRVTDLGWWDRTRVGDIDVTAVPARHGVPENGYVLAAGGVTAYVAGDTRYYDELVDVATVFPALDVAVLPVGGLRLLGFPREMGPGDAARAAAVLGARRLIPMGYGEEGAFPLRWHALRPVERFVKACAEHGIDRQRIVVLEPGESWHYYK